jgi:hypothetical protein
VGVDDERKELSVGILDAIGSCPLHFRCHPTLSELQLIWHCSSVGRFDSFKAIESTAKNFSQGENATVVGPPSFLYFRL